MDVKHRVLPWCCPTISAVKALKIAQKFGFKINGLLARPERFERPTPRFVVWCSIQLSYGRVFRVTLGLNGPLHQKSNRKVAKERFSYPLRPELARSGTEASTGSDIPGRASKSAVADLENNRGELG
jgi:hypothetical protein